MIWINIDIFLTIYFYEIISKLNRHVPRIFIKILLFVDIIIIYEELSKKKKKEKLSNNNYLVRKHRVSGAPVARKESKYWESVILNRILVQIMRSDVTGWLDWSLRNSIEILFSREVCISMYVLMKGGHFYRADSVLAWQEAICRYGSGYWRDQGRKFVWLKGLEHTSVANNSFSVDEFPFST